MGRRRIERFQYRHALVRLRVGDTAREIARSGLMGQAGSARCGRWLKRRGVVAAGRVARRRHARDGAGQPEARGLDGAP